MSYADIDRLRAVLIETQVELLAARQQLDEEASFPLSAAALRVEAIKQLKAERLLPEDY